MYLRREKEKKGKQITIYHDLKIDIYWDMAATENEIKMNECDMAAQ
jgi:hypothetical protein